VTNELELINVSKQFGLLRAVRSVRATIEQGEFFSFLGPSGCGKTTILRMISGFIDPSEGDITLGGRSLKGIGPDKRPTALIFQNLALFPLMSVADNITYGLRIRNVPTAERRRKLEALLALVDLTDYGDKRIDELSGGQKQRVAIARALAVEPKVLLLDEPLSALDLQLRQRMRSELRELQRRTGVTFIYITHDQGEALAMSDRVAVMSNGSIEQTAVPSEIYDNPATAFVASFVGSNNVIRGRVSIAAPGTAAIETSYGVLWARNPKKLSSGAEGLLFVRPERLRLAGIDDQPGDNVLESRVSSDLYEGVAVNVFFRSERGDELTMHLPNNGFVPDLKPDTVQRLTFLPEHATILPPQNDGFRH
jgi:spermidine/putrescine transport system ATP-binding protein